jgi:hypothetical protein
MTTLASCLKIMNQIHEVSHGPKPSRYSEHNIEIMNSRQNPSRPKDPNLSDHDRPLEELGKDDALCMGKLISRDKKDLVPDLIISSNGITFLTEIRLQLICLSQLYSAVLTPSCRR